MITPADLVPSRSQLTEDIDVVDMLRSVPDVVAWGLFIETVPLAARHDLHDLLCNWISEHPEQVRA